MDRYVRIERPRPVVDIKENEILIMATGKMRNYITDATALLEEKHFDTIVFKGMGRAINKAVTIAEITKRRVVGTAFPVLDINHDTIFLTSCKGLLYGTRR